MSIHTIPECKKSQAVAQFAFYPITEGINPDTSCLLKIPEVYSAELICTEIHQKMLRNKR